MIGWNEGEMCAMIFEAWMLSTMHHSCEGYSLEVLAKKLSKIDRATFFE